MPTGPGGLDANGVWQYGEDDTEALASDLLNLGMGSVSTALASLPAPADPAILQVVSTTKTDTFTTTGTTWVDVTGLSATITPSSSSNKVLVILTTSIGAAPAVVAAAIRLSRGGTPIGVADAAGARGQVSATGIPVASGEQIILGVDFLDSPATTSSITYSAQLKGNTANLVAINRSVTDSNATGVDRTVSTITLMEVAG